MAYLVRITEWRTGGREFLIPYAELPADLAQAILKAKPASTAARSMTAEDPECFAMLDGASCRIVNMSEIADNQALDLGA
jgi:hypothetical protein